MSARTSHTSVDATRQARVARSLVALRPHASVLAALRHARLARVLVALRHARLARLARVLVALGKLARVLVALGVLARVLVARGHARVARLALRARTGVVAAAGYAGEARTGIVAGARYTGAARTGVAVRAHGGSGVRQQLRAGRALCAELHVQVEFAAGLELAGARLNVLDLRALLDADEGATQRAERRLLRIERLVGYDVLGPNLQVLGHVQAEVEPPVTFCGAPAQDARVAHQAARGLRGIKAGLVEKSVVPDLPRVVRLCSLGVLAARASGWVLIRHMCPPGPRGAVTEQVREPRGVEGCTANGYRNTKAGSICITYIIEKVNGWAKQVATDSRVMPGAEKKAVAAARSSTTTLTWANLLIVMSPP